MCVCMCVWVVLFALACWLLLSLLPPRCCEFRFTRQQSALPLPLPLLRPRPLPPPLLLLPSYSCVAFFLTFAEFIDIFSICFCALLSLSERALSLFLPLFLSLGLLLFLLHTHRHLFFLLFFVENNLQFYLIALLSTSLLHTRTHTSGRTFDSCCCFFFVHCMN